MKKFKLGFLRAARSLGGFALARRFTGNGVRILCYHGIWLGRDSFPGDAMFMRAETFRERLDIIRRLGYPVVPLDTAVAALEGKCQVPRNALAITIDDGWYSTYAEMLPALRERGMPATLYVDSEHLRTGLPVPHVMARYLHQVAGKPGHEPAVLALAEATDLSTGVRARLDAVEIMADELGIDFQSYRAGRAFDYMTEHELAEAYGSGLDVQLHTHTHSLHDQSATRVAREIADNRQALAEMLDVAPEQFRHFCYPSGVCSLEAAAELDRLGLASSTTTEQRIARPGMQRQLLPRILDGEQLSPIEFEAELSGFADLMRGLRRLLGR